MAVKERPLHGCPPLYRISAIEQQFYSLVTFAVERGEGEDEEAEGGTTNKKFDVGILETAKDILQLIRENSILFQKDGKVGLINDNGSIIIEIFFYNIYNFLFYLVTSTK